MFNSKKEYMILTGPYSKEQLKKLVQSGKVTKKSLVDNAEKYKKQSNFKEANSLVELEGIFSPDKKDLNTQIEALKSELNGILDVLKGSKQSLANNLEIPSDLWTVVHEYLEDNLYTIYLTTGFDDEKPSFLILVENDLNPLRIDCSIPINTEKWNVEDFEKWPDIANKTAQIWKMSK
jgi:hypothetical protein